MTNNIEFDVPERFSVRNAADKGTGIIVIAISSVIAVTVVNIWFAIRAASAAKKQVSRSTDATTTGNVDHWSDDGRAFAVRRPRA